MLMPSFPWSWGYESPSFFHREKQELLLGPWSPGREAAEGQRSRPPALPSAYPVGADGEGDPLPGGLRRLERVGGRGQRRFVQVLGAARRQQQAGPPRVVHLHRAVPEQHHQPFRRHRTGDRATTPGALRPRRPRRRTAGTAGWGERPNSSRAPPELRPSSGRAPPELPPNCGRAPPELPRTNTRAPPELLPSCSRPALELLRSSICRWGNHHAFLLSHKWALRYICKLHTVSLYFLISFKISVRLLKTGESLFFCCSGNKSYQYKGLPPYL